LFRKRRSFGRERPARERGASADAGEEEGCEGGGWRWVFPKLYAVKTVCEAGVV